MRPRTMALTTNMNRSPTHLPIQTETETLENDVLLLSLCSKVLRNYTNLLAFGYKTSRCMSICWQFYVHFSINIH